MATVQAFRGLRYNLSRVRNLSEVTAPPYDIIDPAMQEALYARHPQNVVRLILNRWESADQPDSRYRRAASYWREWCDEGLLVAEERPALYAYHQEFSHRGESVTRRGLIARLQIEPWGTGGVYPHEATHAGPKLDRLQLTRACRANFSPIFGLIPDAENAMNETLQRAIKSPAPCEATDAGQVVHRMWPLTDPTLIERVQQIVKPHPVYIADGHHRYETAMAYRQELDDAGVLTADHAANFVMMALFSMSDPGLIVLPTHRLIRGAPAMGQPQLIDRLGPYFEVAAVARGPRAAAQVWEQVESMGSQSTFAIYTRADQTWSLLTRTEQGRARMAQISPHSPTWNELGVSLLHELAIKDRLGLTNLPTPLYVRGEDQVTYYLENGDVSGRDLTGQEASGEDFQLAAMVMPASVSHVAEISQLGERMPAKSTYFYPKLLTGLVFNPLTND